MSEIASLQQLKHPNLINLVGFNNKGVVKQIVKGKVVKEIKDIIYLVLELAVGGELFDFVALGGRFSEPTARYYFKQLMSGICHIHNSGFSHRDLKPENLFLDERFNLKIADFGFASQIGNNNGSLLKTRLGTEAYMAPEFFIGKPYSGAAIDLFSCGIILFIMVVQTPPFLKAVASDPLYRMLIENKEESFWRAHLKNKPSTFHFSESFKLLVTGLL
jgi:serine/threonine protein kinase